LLEVQNQTKIRQKEYMKSQRKTLNFEEKKNVSPHIKEIMIESFAFKDS